MKKNNYEVMFHRRCIGSWHASFPGSRRDWTVTNRGAS